MPEEKRIQLTLDIYEADWNQEAADHFAKCAKLLPIVGKLQAQWSARGGVVLRVCVGEDGLFQYWTVGGLVRWIHLNAQYQVETGLWRGQYKPSIPPGDEFDNDIHLLAKHFHQQYLKSKGKQARTPRHH